MSKKKLKTEAEIRAELKRLLQKAFKCYLEIRFYV